uniref:Mediator of RNA polymerase II transcription subunit 8 n=1 Tax=Aceria tosichella TaxID=561515 RepID=A0A6G1SFW5_9ACAR
MVRGEEKQFEVTIDRLLEYTKNLKVSLEFFIHKIETEGDKVDWPQVLDSFTSICGQINTLMRFTRDNRSQFIENRVVLPLLLTPDRDEELAKLTENRVFMVNHEMVPCYLRTKPDPEIEEFDKSLQAKASTISPDVAVKQINAMTKLVDNIVNTIKANSTRADTEMSRQSMKPSFENADTNSLIMAISTGKGLTISQHRGKQADPSTGTSKAESSRPGMQKQNVKAPELKTNIKAGM